MRCKVGDLVMVKEAAYTENIGRFGTVSAPFEEDSWVIVPQRTFFGSKIRGFRVEEYESAEGTVFEDWKLLPVNPGDLQEVENSEVKKERACPTT